MADGDTKGKKDKKDKKSKTDVDAAEGGDPKPGKDSTSGDGAKRVELVDGTNSSAHGLPGYLGVGMLGGIILGFGPLRDAAQGNGPFEDAMLRFVACLVFCVAAASFIGRVLDDIEPDDEPTSSAGGGPAGLGDATADGGVADPVGQPEGVGVER